MRPTHRQSNQPEYCPICCKRLPIRSAAVSHYRAHERQGEITARSSYPRDSWYVPATVHIWRTDALWFAKGFAYDPMRAKTSVEEARAYFWADCFMKRAGVRGGCDKDRYIPPPLPSDAP